jgi:hypothetical protein
LPGSGPKFSLIESLHGILPREDRDASEMVLESMQNDGVKLLCCGKGLKVSKDDGNKIRFSVDSHGNRYEESVDQLLVAVGRAPNVEGLGLDKAGVAFTQKGVQVNDQLQTTNPNIYAAGDICSPLSIHPCGGFHGAPGDPQCPFHGRAKAGALTIPWCTYTEPEIAHVGLYEKQAQDQGMQVETFTRHFNEVDRAILEGQTNGFARVHVRKGSDKIIGATIVASHAGDLISEITLAMTHGLGLKQIAEYHSSLPHPGGSHPPGGRCLQPDPLDAAGQVPFFAMDGVAKILQEKLDAQKEKLGSAAPKEALEVMHRATEDLENSGIADKAKAKGDVAPDFTLNNYQGQPVTLSQKLAQGPVVLGFYRGGW